MNIAISGNWPYSSKFLGWEIFKPYSIKSQILKSGSSALPDSSAEWNNSISIVDALVLSLFIAYVIYDISDDVFEEASVEIS